MLEVFFVIGGGVWCCESKQYMENYISGTPPSGEQGSSKRLPMHNVIGRRGYRGEGENWPKEGLLCENPECLTFIVKPTPR
jgi:hypothetical protein